MERTVTSALVTVGEKVFWETILMVTLVVGTAEWLTGWKRAAATFWGVHLLASLLLSLIISLTGHQLRSILILPKNNSLHLREVVVSSSSAFMKRYI